MLINFPIIEVSGRHQVDAHLYQLSITIRLDCTLYVNQTNRITSSCKIHARVRTALSFNQSRFISRRKKKKVILRAMNCNFNKYLINFVVYKKWDSRLRRILRISRLSLLCKECCKILSTFFSMVNRRFKFYEKHAALTWIIHWKFTEGAISSACNRDCNWNYFAQRRKSI